MNLPGADEARARMLAAVGPLGAETVSLQEANGRVLARPVRATRAQPPFDASSMDGWAVRRTDARDHAADLLIVGESAAGRPWPGRLEAGQAVRISTGAPVPVGADAVVIQEEALRTGDRVRIGPLHARHSYIRPAGCDFPAGAELLVPGARLTPWSLALAAASGRDVLEIARRPRLAILTTGDELAAAGGEAGAHQIFDSAGPALAAVAGALGAEVSVLRWVGDSVASILGAVDGLAADFLVTIGGASVGDHDLIKPALRERGAELAVDGIAVRPGKPTWFGRLADGRLVLGLPGNPVSALVCAELFLRPLLGRLQGAEDGAVFTPVRAGAPVPRNGGREHFLRGRLSVDADGVLTARVASDQDSSLVSVLSRSNALIRRPANAPEAGTGERVEAALLGPLGTESDNDG